MQNNMHKHLISKCAFYIYNDYDFYSLFKNSCKAGEGP